MSAQEIATTAYNSIQEGEEILDAILNAIRAEREECAKVAGQCADKHLGDLLLSDGEWVAKIVLDRENAANYI